MFGLFQATAGGYTAWMRSNWRNWPPPHRCHSAGSEIRGPPSAGRAAEEQILLLGNFQSTAGQALSGLES